MAAITKRGVALSGEGGFVPEMIKAVLERGMQAGLGQHLGYDKHEAAGRGSGNLRDGTTPKTVAIEVGDVQLDQLRDRNSSVALVLVSKGQRQIGGLADMIISLCAGGMTIWDIQAHLAAILGIELSHEMISKDHRRRRRGSDRVAVAAVGPDLLGHVSGRGGGHGL